jgi:hypothetical protein
VLPFGRLLYDFRSGYWSMNVTVKVREIYEKHPYPAIGRSAAAQAIWRLAPMKWINALWQPTGAINRLWSENDIGGLELPIRKPIVKGRSDHANMCSACVCE